MEEKLARKKQAAALLWVSWKARRRGRSAHLGTGVVLAPAALAGRPMLCFLRCTAETCPGKKLEGDRSLLDPLQELEVKPGRRCSRISSAASVFKITTNLEE